MFSQRLHSSGCTDTGISPFVSSSPLSSLKSRASNGNKNPTSAPDYNIGRQMILKLCLITFHFRSSSAGYQKSRKNWDEALNCSVEGVQLILSHLFFFHRKLELVSYKSLWVGKLQTKVINPATYTYFNKIKGWMFLNEKFEKWKKFELVSTLKNNQI